MNFTGHILLFIGLICALLPTPCFDSNTDCLLELDNAIANSAHFDSIHIAEIEAIKKNLNSYRDNPARLYTTNSALYDLYRVFVCDSALRYADENIDIARQVNRDDLLAESLIKKADVLSKAGLFVESLDILDSIDRNSLPEHLVADYFQQLYSIYLYMAEYSEGTSYELPYESLSQSYRDSTLAHTTNENFVYHVLTGVKLLEEYPDSAVEYINSVIVNYPVGDRINSILNSQLAYYYEMQGDKDRQLYYAIKSAISDITGAVKENMSVRKVSELMYEKGDIERSDRYVKKSLDDAVFFSARMRSNQTARILPLIDSQYKISQERRHRNGLMMLITICIFALMLVIGIVIIWRQKVKLISESAEAHKAKMDAMRLNEELTLANRRVEDTNVHLREADHIKEVYIRDLMLLCSKLIGNTEQYQKQLYKLANARDNQELYSQIKSGRVVAESANDFYETFDRAFLGIFPSFIEQFNALLKPGEATATKVGDKLNTELRIYAMIRLGITETQRIADMLRCSQATVYTYRSKVRARAIDPDNLEADVMSISAI